MKGFIQKHVIPVDLTASYNTSIHINLRGRHFPIVLSWMYMWAAIFKHCGTPACLRGIYKQKNWGQQVLRNVFISLKIQTSMKIFKFCKFWISPAVELRALPSFTFLCEFNFPLAQAVRASFLTTHDPPHTNTHKKSQYTFIIFSVFTKIGFSLWVCTV